MPAGVFSKLLGTITTFFQVGGPAGPGLNDNAGALEAKNAANSAFAIVRGATPPVGDNDLTAKSYVDQLANKPVPASVQFNGGSALPANSGTEKWYVVSTGGVNAALGTLLWDDGSGAGTVQVIPAAVGNTIVTTAAFTGGTDTFVAFHVYVWNGTAWVDVSSSSSTAGAQFVIRIPIALVTVSSATSLPANAIISDAKLDIVTPYTAGATLQLGVTGIPAAFMATTDNTPQTAGTYQLMQDTAAPSANPLLVTITGAPAAGAGYAVLTYSVPNA
jgi:hypothetical protein